MATLTDKILTDDSGRYSRTYREAFSDLLVAGVSGNEPQAAEAMERVVSVTRETMGIAELLAASHVLRAAEGFRSGKYRRGDPTLRFAEQSIVPRVTFDEAIEEFMTRAPRTLRNAAERTALNIAKLYSEDRVAAFVRSAEQTVTEKAQEIIVKALREGLSERQAGLTLTNAVDAIRQLSPDWAPAYADMVFRTNANTASTAGRFRQVQDPDVADVIPALMYDTARDADTRPSHAIMHGFIASTQSRAWSELAPPLGYNCRCQVHLVSRFELEDMGRIRPNGTVIDSPVPAGAKPDDGFRHGGRPDLALG